MTDRAPHPRLLGADTATPAPDLVSLGHRMWTRFYRRVSSCRAKALLVDDRRSRILLSDGPDAVAGDQRYRAPASARGRVGEACAARRRALARWAQRGPKRCGGPRPGQGGRRAGVHRGHGSSPCRCSRQLAAQDPAVEPLLVPPSLPSAPTSAGRGRRSAPG